MLSANLESHNMFYIANLTINAESEIFACEAASNGEIINRMDETIVHFQRYSFD